MVRVSAVRTELPKGNELKAVRPNDEDRFRQSSPPRFGNTFTEPMTWMAGLAGAAWALRQVWSRVETSQANRRSQQQLIQRMQERGVYTIRSQTDLNQAIQLMTSEIERLSRVRTDFVEQRGTEIARLEIQLEKLLQDRQALREQSFPDPERMTELNTGIRQARTQLRQLNQELQQLDRTYLTELQWMTQQNRFYQATGQSLFPQGANVSPKSTWEGAA